MLNPFPALLTYAIFAPTLLRLAAAVLFALIAYKQWHRRDELASLRFLFVEGGAWVVWTMIVIEAATAAALLIGYGTQWAALVGALLALKSAVWGRRYPRMFPLSRIASLLIFVVCLSLLLTGAGAMAFDLPL